MTEKVQFDEWALLELFGHQRIAGRVTEAEIAGGKFIRIDVPEINGAQPITKFFGPSAIYAITPLTEETARRMAGTIAAAPMSKWDARELLKDQLVSNRALPYGSLNSHDTDDEEA